MEQLDVIYLNILRVGLNLLRDVAEAGELAWVRVDAEHLHNVPSLIGESNIRRHFYYTTKEVPHYLEWVKSIGREDVAGRVIWAYKRHWDELNKALTLASQGSAAK